jgi:hypothetical protein
VDLMLKIGSPGLRWRACVLEPFTFPTRVSPMPIPSLSSSPWIRGAPHSVFSRLDHRSVAGRRAGHWAYPFCRAGPSPPDLGFDDNESGSPLIPHGRKVTTR